jgi:hypothetical protein
MKAAKSEEMNPNKTRHARGMAPLQDPRRNSGTAFSEDEREREGLVGLLPETVEDIEGQRRCVLQHLGHKPSDIERYVYLIGLLDRSETLFYRALMSAPARFLPIVYEVTSDRLHLLRPRSLRALAFGERHALTLLEILEPGALDGGGMKEQILPGSDVDEPEPLVCQFLLDDAFGHSIRPS